MFSLCRQEGFDCFFHKDCQTSICGKIACCLDCTFRLSNMFNWTKKLSGSGVSTLFCRTCSDEDIAPYRVYNINQVSPYSTRRINFMSQLILWCDSLVESGVAHHSLVNEKTDNKKFWSNLCCLKAEEKDKDENHFKPLAPWWRHPKVQVWARWSSSWCFGGCRCVTGPGP